MTARRCMITVEMKELKQESEEESISSSNEIIIEWIAASFRCEYSWWPKMAVQRLSLGGHWIGVRWKWIHWMIALEQSVQIGIERIVDGWCRVRILNWFGHDRWFVGMRGIVHHRRELNRHDRFDDRRGSRILTYERMWRCWRCKATDLL